MVLHKRILDSSRSAEITPLRHGLFGAFILGGAQVCLACSSEAAERDTHLAHSEAPLLPAADAYLADHGVECRLRPAADSASKIEMVLENHGKTPVEILTRATPWDGVGPTLVVTNNGNPIPYAGMDGIRRPPQDTDYLHLAPGETLSAGYDVASTHRVAQAGVYEVALQQPLLSAKVDGTPLALQHDCGTLSVALSPTRNIESNASETASVSEPLIFNDSTCSSAEKKQIGYMETLAKSALKMAQSHTGQGDTFYKQWFGTWSSSNSALVATYLQDESDEWANFTGDCDSTGSTGCSGGTGCPDFFAWTCPGNDADLVHLCDDYFTLPSISVEAYSNQAGTLVHEKFHLVSGEFDGANSACTDEGSNWCAGAKDARALAAASSSQAVLNAENYEHFIGDVYLTTGVLPVTLFPLL